MSETKTIKGIEIPNFTSFDLDIKNKPKSYIYPAMHGLTVYINNKFATNCTQLNNPDFSCNSVIWIMITNNFIIGALYLPNESSIHYYNDIFDDLTSDIHIVREKNLPIMLIGDFNSRTGTKNDIMLLDQNDFLDDYKYPDIINMLKNSKIPLERINLDKKTNNNGKKLITMCQTVEACIVNGRVGLDKHLGNFTFDYTSTLDYVICTPDLFPYITDFKVDDFDPLCSDKHNPICITVDIVKYKNQPSTPNQETPLINSKVIKNNWEIKKKNNYKMSFDMGRINSYISKLSQVNLLDVTHNSVGCLANEFKDILNEPGFATGILKEIKVRTNIKSKRLNKKWFNEQCKFSKKNYNKFKNRMNKPPTVVEQINLRTLATNHRKLTRRVRRNYYKDLNNRLKTLKTNNPREYWRILNEGKNKVKIGNIPNISFQNHFSDLNVNTSTKKGPILGLQNQQTNESLNVPFTIEEICKHIKKLKNNKTPGIDNILNEFLKNCPDEALPAIVKLFNIILESGKVPLEWSVGIIKPLYKNKGDINDVNNYRGITLLSCLGKLFTSIINTRLYDYVTRENILGNEQVGFRPKHSTLDHIFALHVITNFYISQGKQLFCAFVDYSKAFDFIDRAYLWQKLLDSGIDGKVLQVIRDMYDNAKSHVSVNNNLSDPFPCQVGVRQGENMSPLLFAMFLNDFKSFLKGKYNGLKKLSASILKELNMYFRIFCLLYADDTIILAESPAQLLKALDALYLYCNKWSMKVNVEKTKVMIFSKGKVKKYKSFKFGSSRIDVVYDYIYLGTKFNFNGTFQLAMAKQVLQAKKAKFGLLSKVRELTLSVETFIDLLDKLVVTRLLSGCEVWGYENPKQLQLMLNHTMRRFLRVHKTTSICMLNGELGLKEISEYIENRMLNFWYKVATGDENKISTILYRWILELYNQNSQNSYKSPWLHKIKTRLDHMGASNLFTNPSNMSGEWFKIHIKLRLNDIYNQKWSDDVAKNSICQNYKIMAVEKQLQEYLKVLPSQYMYAMCKFRCVNSKIPSIVGRYSNQPIEDRTCTLCESNEIGDEFHYLFECSEFNDIRVKYIKKYYYNHPSAYKMNKLFNESNYKQLLNLGKFIYEVIQKFK